MSAVSIDLFLARRRRANPHYAAQEGIQMVAVPEGNLRVRSAGAGSDTVVFVCDMPVVIEHYDRLIALLAPRYRVLCIELPGMGFSIPSPSFRFTLAEQASAVEHVLRALSAQACTLSFPCVNGYLALLLAHNAADLVRRVVVMQTPSWEGAQRWARRIDFRNRGLIATPVLGQLLVAASSRLIARKWFAKVLGGSADAADFSARSNAAFDAGSGWALASLTQAYFSAPPPLLTPIAQPALGHLGSSRSQPPNDGHALSAAVLSRRRERRLRRRRAFARSRAAGAVR